MNPRLQLVPAITEIPKLMLTTKKKRPDGATFIFLITWGKTGFDRALTHLQAIGRGDAGGDGRAGPVRGHALARARRRRRRERSPGVAHVRFRPGR